MVELLDQLISEINHSVDLIDSLDFKPPGIFSNAITQKDVYLDTLLRNVDEEREATLFETDIQNSIPTRKDGKKGVLDYLTDKELNLRRNRHLGLPEVIPIVQNTNDIYKKLEEERSLKKRKLTRNSILLDVDAVTSSVMSGEHSAALKVLTLKFQNEPEVVQLITALKNGTVMTETNSESNKERRKTMFVEDFPLLSMLQVIKEIAQTWPTDNYQQQYQQLNSQYNKLTQEIESLKKEVKLQDDQLITLTKSTPASLMSSNVTTRLIEKEKRDIQEMESRLKQYEKSNQ